MSDLVQLLLGLALGLVLVSLCKRLYRFRQFMNNAKHREACAIAAASAELQRNCTV